MITFKYIENDENRSLKFNNLKESLLAAIIGFVMLLSLVSTLAHANVVWVKPDDGARIELTDSGYYDDSNATITVQRNFQNGIDILFPTADQSFNRIDLVGPNNSEIVVGEYLSVQRYNSLEPDQAGFSVGGFGWCEATEPSSFIIHDVTYLPDGSVDSLALDATIYCTANLRKSEIFVRINSSLPIGPVGPISNAGNDQVVLPNSNANLDASNSYSTDAVGFSYQWQQIDGTSVVLTDTTQATPSFTSPALNASYEFLRFRVTITDTLNRQSSDTVTVTVSDNVQPQTQMVLRTNTNDWLGRVSEEVIIPTDYPWRVVRSGDKNGINIVADCTNVPINISCSQYSSPPNVDLWTADYSPPAIGPSDASYSTASFISDAGMTYFNSSCRVTHYHVLDVAYQPNGAVDRLAVNFYSNCNGGLQGFIRINSVLPLVPTHALVSAGRDRLYSNGETVILDGRNTWDANLDSANYVWQQISGPSVNLFSPNQKMTSFTAPDVSLGGGDMEFELTVTNDQGQVRTDRVALRILGSQDPNTYIYMHHDPADYDSRWYFTENEAYIAARHIMTNPNVANSMLLAVSNPRRVDFMVPGGAAITPGTYYIEPHPYDPFDYSNGLIDMSTTTCNSYRGQFIVHEIETDVDGQVTRLALDFSYFDKCYSSTGLTQGVIRINSNIPRATSNPVADPGPAITEFVGNTIQLDATDSWNLGGDITSYQWQQVSGAPVVLNYADSLRASFVAPEVVVGDEALVFQLTVSDVLGNVSSQNVTINIIPNSTIQTAAWFMERNRSAVITNDTSTASIRASENINSVTGEQQSVQISLYPDNFTLKAPNGQTLGVGIYDYAGEFSGFVNYSTPLFRDNFLQPDLCLGEVRHKFIIYEIEYNPDNDQVDVLAFNFQLFCESQTQPFTQGGVRINSSVPMINPIPHATGGKDIVAEIGQNVTLDASSSGDLDGSIISYEWVQESGTAVTLVDSTMPQARFTVPQIVGPEETLQFLVTVTDNNGNTQSDRVNVRIVTPQAPRQTVRLYVGDETNPNPNTPTYIFDENNAYITESRSSEKYLINIASSTSVRIGLLAPGWGVLTTGTYEIGVDGFVGESWLGVDINSQDCWAPGGQFSVLEVEYDANGRLIVLAVDFEKHCFYEDRVIRGSVRFNSAWQGESVELPNASATVVTTGSSTVVTAGTVQSESGKGGGGAMNLFFLLFISILRKKVYFILNNRRLPVDQAMYNASYNPKIY